MSSRVARLRSLLATGSGRFPVRRCAPLLSRIMDDQRERTPERRTRDVQFHWNIRRHRHGSSGPRPVGASRSLQTLLSREHVPAFDGGFNTRSGSAISIVRLERDIRILQTRVTVRRRCTSGRWRAGCRRPIHNSSACRLPAGCTVPAVSSDTPDRSSRRRRESPRAGFPRFW